MTANPVNPVVTGITFRAVLGRRRALLLLGLPLVLLVLAVTTRLLIGGVDDTATEVVLHRLSLGTLLPLLALIAGTGVIGPEIDDGAIMYLLTKPVRRQAIVNSKLLVAVTVVAVFGALPTLVAGLVLTGTDHGSAAGFAIGVLAGGTAYAALFLALAVISRYAVVIGLVYALLWETVIGGYVSGVRNLSVQQWALSVTDALVDAPEVTSEVGLTLSVVMLVLVSVAATVFAGSRLRSLNLTGED